MGRKAQIILVCSPISPFVIPTEGTHVTEWRDL